MNLKSVLSMCAAVTIMLLADHALQDKDYSFRDLSQVAAAR